MTHRFKRLSVANNKPGARALCSNDPCAVLGTLPFPVAVRFRVRSPMARSQAMDVVAPRKSRKTTCPEDRENLGEGSFGRDPLTFIDCRDAAAGSSAIPATGSAKQAVNFSLRSRRVSHLGNRPEQKSKVCGESKSSLFKDECRQTRLGTGPAVTRAGPLAAVAVPTQGFGIVPVRLVDVGNSNSPIVRSS
jgi:hypothetical protein